MCVMGGQARPQRAEQRRGADVYNNLYEKDRGCQGAASWPWDVVAGSTIQQMTYYLLRTGIGSANGPQLLY